MLGKRLRFTVFERDGFTCQYCGEKPPNVILHVDHMVSRKDGGQDDEDNLITSCRDCNLGKSSKSVDVQKLKNTSYKKELAELEERKNQLEAYYEYVRRKKQIAVEENDVFQNCWQECSAGSQSLTDKGLRSVRNLLKLYSSDMIFEAMAITWEAEHVNRDSKFRYMCGVLKKMKINKSPYLRSDGE